MGQTSNDIEIEHGYLTAYRSYAETSTGQAVPWAEIEAWLNEQHPECKFVCVTDKDTVLARELARELGLGIDPTLREGDMNASGKIDLDDMTAILKTLVSAD